MAERFPDCDPKQLQELKENTENTNTKKSTKTWLTVWTTWAEEKGYSPDIVSYEAKELDEKLQKFFAEVRKKDGSPGGGGGGGVLPQNTYTGMCRPTGS